MNKHWNSKVDWWIGAILVMMPVVTLGGSIAAYVSGSGVAAALLPVAFVAAIFGLVVFPLYYELTDDALVIRFGLFRSKIPYESIRQVVPTRNPLSSPALSLDRLHIDTGNPLGPNISPAERSAFLDALVSRTSRLKRDGDRLVPR
ncbi:MAG: PH domain-containing protein [Myxococcales bacterium]|nr:PH domain-containing protein [Myxococcales bacterium]